MSTDIARSHRTNGSSSSSHTRNGSGRSSSTKSTPQVESAVTRLLVAIKQLLESLTFWSTGKMTETEVSDVYVRLGNDFNTCVVAFAAYDIDMRELRGVPEELRNVLETALAEDANPETLEKYLPQVRQIITDLLQGLRNKQSLFRQNATDRAQRRAERQNSGGGSSTTSGQRSSGRSSSKPRPLPPPRITEEAQPLPPSVTASPPLLSQPPPSGPSPSKPVASAVPDRISLSNRRKHSYGRGSSPLASDTETPPSSTNRFVGGFAGRVPAQPDEDGLADLVANASAAEERLRSPPRGARRLPIPPSVGSPPISEREDPFERSGSARSSATITQADAPMPQPSGTIPAASVSPNVKRYSLSDRPLSPPANSPPTRNGIPPAFAVTAASPSPPTTSTVTFQATGEQSTSSTATPVPDSLLDPNQSPAVEQSLVALQQTDALARKASKRFSSFTFTKMAGGSASSGLGALGGGTKPMSSSKSLNRRSIAPSASIGQLTSKDLEALAEVEEPTSPLPNSAKARTSRPDGDVQDTHAGGRRAMSRSPSRANVPLIPTVLPEAQSPAISRSVSMDKRPLVSDAAAPTAVNGHVAAVATSNAPAVEPPPTLEFFTVFLQVGRHVKKVAIDPDSALSFASLRVLFVDKFSYNPGQDNFPAIYIRDGTSGVQYELEDIEEVKDGVLLSLNIEPLDQVKQHIDLQMSSLSNDIKDLRTAINAQKRQSFMAPTPTAPENVNVTPPAPRPSEQQLHLIARRLSKLRGDDGKFASANFSTPKPLMQPLMEQSTGSTYQTLIPQSTGGSSWTFTSETGTTTRIVNDLKSQFDEIQNLRRDLGVMRQLYLDFISQTKESLGALRTQTSTVKDLANAKVGGARSYINSGKKSLDSRTQTVLTKIEELQDMVESLKDDVLKRHMSPKSSVMKTLSTDIEASRQELEALKEHITTIKPMWKKTWEEELQTIVEEQQFLSHQEEFIEDLIEDHKALLEVYGHVERIVSIRNTTMSASGFGRGGRVMRTGRSFRPPPPDPGHDGLNTVMLEIRGAAVDPERRMKAIEANQKARHRDLEARSNEFEEELGDFVGAKKLKKTGGIEETERLRQARNDYALKNMFSPASGGAAGGTMVSATHGGGMNGSGGGAAFGMGGLTFAKAPPANFDDSTDNTDGGGMFGSLGAGGLGIGGFTFAKAPPIPDSP